MTDRIKALEDALTLAANRLHRVALDFDTGSRRFIEALEWADEARAALAASQPAQPVAWLDKQELEYLQMVTGNKGWSGYQRVIMVGGEKEGCAPLYAAPQPLTVQDAARVPETEAEWFERADWFWRTMAPHDNGDNPSEAMHRGMIGYFRVCEIGSSYTGPTRYGFIAPVLDAESDDEEFLHFATEEEALDAAKARIAALRAIAEGRA